MRSTPMFAGLVSLINEARIAKGGKPMVRKTRLFAHLYMRTIILPRQARDKHRESTQKKRRVFLQGFLNPFIYQVRKRVFLRHLYINTIFLQRQARD